jgi:hypothetical protein
MADLPEAAGMDPTRPLTPGQIAKDVTGEVLDGESSNDAPSDEETSDQEAQEPVRDGPA